MPLKQLSKETAAPMQGSHKRKDLMPLVKQRSPLNHKHVPFVVCWSQKAGCTAILKWFFYHAGLLDAALEYHDPNHKLQLHSYENKVFKARPGYKREMVDQIIAGKPVIKFIRCPYQRLFSSYMQINNVRFMRVQAMGKETPGMLLRKEVLEFLYSDSSRMGRPISFRGYLEWLQEQNPDTLDPHHAPQCVLLDEAIPIRYYRLEDFDSSVELLEKEFSLETTSAIRDQFSSNHHNKKQQFSRSDALEFLNKAPSLKRLGKVDIPKITRELLETTEFDPLIRQLFAKDIVVYDTLGGS